MSSCYDGRMTPKPFNVWEPRIPTEDEDCKALVQWMELKRLRFSHIPQETFTKSWKVKARNKAMGVKPGIPDYIVHLPAKVSTQTGETDSPARLLFIEMKRKGLDNQPSRTSPEQRAWLAMLNEVPYVCAVVCYGYDQAVAAIEAELKG